ncbi:MAG: molybdate ABC transporter permease subunit [Candidatus Aquicultor sp.]
MDVSAIWLSVKVSIIAVAIVLVLGTCLATWMLRSQRRGRALVDSVVMLPLVLPPSVVGFLLLLAFGKYGPLGTILDRFGIQVVFSWQSAVIVSVVVSLPLMYQSVKTALESVDPKLEQAARILGAGELKVLRTITFPIAWPGFVSGTIMVFARSLGEFGATLMISGNIPGKTQTIPLAIYSASQSGDMAGAGFLVLIIVATSFSLVFGLGMWKKRAIRWQ